MSPTGLPGRVVVIGAGTMGVGIAAAFARRGVAVTVVARRESSAAAAAGALAGAVPGRRAPLETTTDGDAALGDADLVVETIPEVLADKVALLARVGALVRSDTVVTTNTSGLDVSAVVAGVAGPERCAALHWFNPADVVALVEVVPAPGTDPATLDRLRDWMVALGKTPVVLARPVPGFVANRLQYALLREAWALVEAGVCSPEDVDRAVTGGLGPRWAGIGPFQTMDLAGLDVHLAVAEALFPVLAVGTRPPAGLAALVGEGALGAKSGTGLLGSYPPVRTSEVLERRDRVLRVVAAALEPPVGA